MSRQPHQRRHHPQQQNAGRAQQRKSFAHAAGRAAQIFRLAAQSLHAAKSALGDHFRRMRGRIGAPEAITATAHKLARIYYAVLKTRTPYDESRIAGSPEQQALKRRQRLEKQAAKLGFALSPLPT